MKKLAILIVLLVAVGAAASAEAGFFITPEAEIQVGLGNYFRGAGVGCQAIFDIGGIGAGLEVKFDYDAALANPNIPLFLVVSFTPAFYLMAGETIGLGDPVLTSSDGTKITFNYGGFPNTYGLGVKILRLNLGFAKLAIGTELFYTVMTSTAESGSLENAVGNLVAIFTNLKASVYGGLEFKI